MNNNKSNPEEETRKRLMITLKSMNHTKKIVANLLQEKMKDSIESWEEDSQALLSQIYANLKGCTFILAKLIKENALILDNINLIRESIRKVIFLIEVLKWKYQISIKLFSEDEEN